MQRRSVVSPLRRVAKQQVTSGDRVLLIDSALEKVYVVGKGGSVS